MTNALQASGATADWAKSSALISIRCAGVVYDTSSGPVEALRDVSLDIGAGEFVALVGPSGCGKSTLMRAIAGLREVTSGQVVVDGSLIRGPISQVGMVFQQALLLRWRSVLENVLLPVELAGMRRTDYMDRARALLTLVGLDGFSDKRPAELSGGMQQRVALCRALILDPPILLMDEPFGALDAMTRDDMNVELLRIWGQADESRSAARKTIVFVTHSIPEAVFLADRVVVMSARPGRVVEDVTVSVARPRTVQTRAQPEFARLGYDIYSRLVDGAGRAAAPADAAHW